MDVVLVLNVFVVDRVGSDSICLMGRFEKHEELFLELVGELRNGRSSFGTDSKHLSHVRFGARMSLFVSSRLSIRAD